jgi:hypothetical protein
MWPEWRENRYPKAQGGVRILPFKTLSAKAVLTSALTVIACLGLVAEASAEHARPKAATPMNIRLVPAFEECFGPNQTHGPPLAVPSCNPVIESSTYLSMQAPERLAPWLGSADGTGLVTLKVTCLLPGTTTQVTGSNTAPPCADAGDQIDVKLTVSMTGVRCKGVGGQGNCAGGAASLYNGKVLVDLPARVTDHHNQIIPNPAGADCSDTVSCTATTDSANWPIGLQCASGTCNVTTSFDLAVPGSNIEGKRSVIQLGAVEIQDAGLNGQLAAAPAPAAGACPPACQADGDANTVFMTQGTFVP